MARTTLTKTTALGAYSASYATANAADATFTAADASNGNQFVAGNNDLVVVRNSGASPYTLTISSVVDPYARTGDITTYSIGAGEYAVFGPFRNVGWMQSDGYVYLTGSNASLLIGVIALPS